MATTLTVITENTVPGKAPGLYAEHGFSLFLSRPEAKILFDAGPAGLATLNNAPRLGVDLKAADRDRKSTRLNSSHYALSRMPSSA